MAIVISKFGFERGSTAKVVMGKSGHAWDGLIGEVIGFTAAKVYIDVPNHYTLLVRPENLVRA